MTVENGTQQPQRAPDQEPEEAKKARREALQSLIEKLEEEAGISSEPVRYTPGVTEVYGTFINFLKEFAGEGLYNADSTTRAAWEKALEILTRFVAHLSRPDSTFTKEVLEIVRAKYAEIESAGQELFGEKTLSVTGKKVKSVGLPVDKVNSKIWRLLESDLGGQLAFAAESVKDKGKRQLSIYFSIDFSALDSAVKITRQLEPYDKRVYIAIGALWAAGNQIITIRQIYYAMGGEGEPSQNQMQKIDDALTKMSAARIFINNAEEAQAYKYPSFRYDASLLPMERVKARINGNQVESAIHLFREPPLISFARGRKQITPIRRELLTTPLNWTNQNLSLEDYLLECIAHAQRGTRSKKMLYAKIYAEAKITAAKQKQRAPEKIRAILDHYKKQGHIKGYTEESDGITLIL